uniref:Uncharacterized protein n=1 Tax=Rhizophora mucronata TaxID=61149 RepID=A0A2P2NVQ1_RHIMU
MTSWPTAIKSYAQSKIYGLRVYISGGNEI